MVPQKYSTRWILVACVQSEASPRAQIQEKGSSKEWHRMQAIKLQAVIFSSTLYIMET